MSIVVRVANWQEPDQREALYGIRHKVFVIEQSVPVEEEIDAFDDTSVHFIAETEDGIPVGCARLLPCGQIGRMAVLQQWRVNGIGRLLINAAMQEAMRQGLEEVILHAQLQAQEFYQRNGFTAYGEDFLDANIPHVCMRRDLIKDPLTQ